MPTKFERDLAAFRHHVREMRDLGFQHVSVKYGGKAFHVESQVGPGSDAVGAPIGFVSEPDETEDDEPQDRLGRPVKV